MMYSVAFAFGVAMATLTIAIRAMVQFLRLPVERALCALDRVEAMSPRVAYALGVVWSRVDLEATAFRVAASTAAEEGEAAGREASERAVAARRQEILAAVEAHWRRRNS